MQNSRSWFARTRVGIIWALVSAMSFAGSPIAWGLEIDGISAEDEPTALEVMPDASDGIDADGEVSSPSGLSGEYIDEVLYADEAAGIGVVDSNVGDVASADDIEVDASTESVSDVEVDSSDEQRVQAVDSEDPARNEAMVSDDGIHEVADKARDASSSEKKSLVAQADKRTISRATVTKISTQAYTGKALKPAVTVKWGKSKLKRGTDYTLSYANNTKPGTARVTIRGKGNYTGTKRVTFRIVAPSVSYYAHRQSAGWEEAWSKRNGATAGSIGIGKRLEAIRIKLSRKPVSGSILYKSHVQGSGWERSWKSNGATSGTTGKGKRIEAIQIKLTGALAKKYNVYYCVHIQRHGWMGWAKNGAKAGSAGCAYRMEAIRIKLVPKGLKAPDALSGNPAFIQSNSGKVGWQNPVGYPQVSASSVKLPSYCMGSHTYVTPSRISVDATRAQCIDAFIARAYEYLGTRFCEPWAREPGVGIDCSGLVLQCLYATGMDLEHARGTEEVGGYNPYNHYWRQEQTYNSWNWERFQTFKPVSLSQIRRGDLLYYHGHVAIYLGDGKIIHAYAPVVCIADMGSPTSAGRPFV